MSDKPDRLRMIAQSPEGLFGLTEDGRLFLYKRDPRAVAGPHGSERLMWTEIPGPLASVEDQIKRAADAAAKRAADEMREHLGAA